MLMEFMIISNYSEEGFSQLFVSINHTIIFQKEQKEDELKTQRQLFKMFITESIEYIKSVELTVLGWPV